jgi:hypothetical protein
LLTACKAAATLAVRVFTEYREHTLVEKVIRDEIRRMTLCPGYSAAVCRVAPVPKRRSI